MDVAPSVVVASCARTSEIGDERELHPTIDANNRRMMQWYRIMKGSNRRTTALTGPRQVKFPFRSRPIRGSVSNALFCNYFARTAGEGLLYQGRVSVNCESSALGVSLPLDGYVTTRKSSLVMCSKCERSSPSTSNTSQQLLSVFFGLQPQAMPNRIASATFDGFIMANGKTNKHDPRPVASLMTARCDRSKGIA